jgi:adenine/guanine phosphoribosyltransferase-like PRPP-binding protein
MITRRRMLVATGGLAVLTAGMVLAQAVTSQAGVQFLTVKETQKCTRTMRAKTQ